MTLGLRGCVWQYVDDFLALGMGSMLGETVGFVAVLRFRASRVACVQSLFCVSARRMLQLHVFDLL